MSLVSLETSSQTTLSVAASVVVGLYIENPAELGNWIKVQRPLYLKYFGECYGGRRLKLRNFAEYQKWKVSCEY